MRRSRWRQRFWRSRRSPRARRADSRAVAGALLAACALSHVLLVIHASRVPVALIETSLSQEVRRFREILRDRLLDFLGHAAEDPRWQALASAPGGALEKTAFDTWRHSDLGKSGTRSAVAVMDTQDRVVTSFAYGLPDSVFQDAAPYPPRPADPSGPSAPGAPALSETALTVLSLRVPLLRGDAVLLRGQTPIGRISAMVSTEWDNLPFLTRSDPLLGALSARGGERTYDEYFGGPPLFVAYGRSGEVLSPSSEQIAALPSFLLDIKKPVWTTVSLAGTSYRTCVFPTPDGPRGIGYVPEEPVAIIAGFLRALVVLLPLIGAVLAMGIVLRPGMPLAALSPGRWIASLWSSYPRRLQTVVLASALLPLLLISAVFRNTIEQKAREGVEQAGMRTAATIRRLVEDYAESGAAGSGEALRIDSRTLFWLSRTVHQDIHLFLNEELFATSRGDPEASGLRSFRLDPAVARALARRRAPQIVTSETPGTGGTGLVYAPVRLSGGPGEGVLAVPLGPQELVVARIGEAIADALLVATLGLGLTLAAIGYLFARRLAVPIRELAGASARIAAGRLDVRVRAGGGDEIGRLVDSFNHMAAALGEQREDLRRRKDYIEAILLNVTTGVISTGPDGVIRTSNPAASLILGVPVEIAGRNLFDVLRAGTALDPILDLWSRGSAQGGAADPAEVSIRRDGDEIRLRSVVLPLAETPGVAPGWIYLLEDVTEVMRSNRLEAWAEMARRIAHEIKNPLTPIQLSAEHLLRVRRDRVEGSEAIVEQCVGTILDQVRALREISSEFSTYARLPGLRLEPVKLRDTLEAVLSPYRRSPPAGVTIEIEAEDVEPLAADRLVLQRAFVNLVENALKAMESGGVLRVSLRSLSGAPDPAAEIVVQDTGEGMTPATLARIFEPYFSTRDGGTGLGLAIARRAIEEHGGTITAESVPSRGTRMIVRLPLRDGPGKPPPTG
jgi:signal transduction histidine kinase/HAMP domain-containing protein